MVIRVKYLSIGAEAPKIGPLVLTHFMKKLKMKNLSYTKNRAKCLKNCILHKKIGLWRSLTRFYISFKALLAEKFISKPDQKIPKSRNFP
jgi:hypothetical protein